MPPNTIAISEKANTMYVKIRPASVSLSVDELGSGLMETVKASPEAKTYERPQTTITIARLVKIFFRAFGLLPILNRGRTTAENTANANNAYP